LGLPESSRYPSLDIFNPDGSLQGTFPIQPGYFINKQLVLADLVGNSQLEAVAIGGHWGGSDIDTGAVFAWQSNGQQLNANFPIQISYQDQSLYYAGPQQVLVGDIEGDGNKELVVFEGTSATSYSPHLFGSGGLPRQWNAPNLDGFPMMMALADFDHNGKLELVFLGYDANYVRSLHVLQPDGSERPGWPQLLKMKQVFAIGDLNRDGHYEIVTWCDDGLHVINADGTPFSKAFPWAPPIGTNNDPVALADINGDGYPEIITGYGNTTLTSGDNSAYTLLAMDRNGVRGVSA
jgi:hypothetical protein